MRTIMFRVALLAVLFVFTACGSKITTDNYDKIQTGMSQEEVEKILGKPTDSGGGGIGGMSAGTATWKDGDKSIAVTFMNGKVTLKVKSGI